MKQIMQRIGIFDIIGGYFADVFANAIYFSVKKTVNAQRSSNIKDEYRKLIVGYAQSMHDDENLFESTMVNMCRYYNKVNSKNASQLSSIEFEDLIISNFIAKEHHQKIKPNHRKSILHGIMFETVNFLVHEIIDRPDDVMAKIFEHDTNIGHTLREIATDSIKSQKETMANRLTKENIPKSSDIDLITRLKSEINQKITELVQAKEDYKKSMTLLTVYKSHSDSIKKQVTELTEEISRRKTENKQHTDRIAGLAKENEDQRRQIAEMKDKITQLTRSAEPAHPSQPILMHNTAPASHTTVHPVMLPKPDDTYTIQQVDTRSTEQRTPFDNESLSDHSHRHDTTDDDDIVEQIEFD